MHLTTEAIRFLDPGCQNYLHVTNDDRKLDSRACVFSVRAGSSRIYLKSFV